MMILKGDAQVHEDDIKGGCSAHSLLRYERQICRGRAAAARQVLGWTESHFVASKVLLIVFKPKFGCLFVVLIASLLNVCFINLKFEPRQVRDLF